MTVISLLSSYSVVEGISFSILSILCNGGDGDDDDGGGLILILVNAAIFASCAAICASCLFSRILANCAITIPVKEDGNFGVNPFLRSFL